MRFSYTFNNTNNGEVNYTQYKYWRYDRISPQYNVASGLMLASIPDRLRIPPSRFNDIEDYIRQLYTDHPDPKNTTNSFLLEYNPSLVLIPSSMRMYLPKNARYITSLRVTPANQCFSEPEHLNISKDIWDTIHSVSYLGIALLDDRYQILPGYDAVIDLDVQLGINRWKWKGPPAVTDYRLTVLMLAVIFLAVYAD